VRIAALLSVLMASLAVPIATGAETTSPFHLDLRGTLPLPFGSYPGSQRKASDVLGPGGGFTVTATLDLGKH
jgi:hypothetical protein